MSLIAQLMDNMEAQVGGGKKGEKLEVDPMTDPRVGKIDLFPNNFKYLLHYVDSECTCLYSFCLSTQS